MEVLYSLDLAIFYFFNHTISTGFLDKFFAIITNVKNWYIAYVILAGIALVKGGSKGRIVVIGILILILVSDQLGYRVLKELIQRARPCVALKDALTPIGCTGSFSFPSNHALNNFAAATFLYKFYPKFKWAFFSTAILVSLSRVYLGVHYPSDILGGALIGAFLGYVFSIAAQKIILKFERKKE